MPITFEEKMKLRPKQETGIIDYLKGIGGSIKDVFVKPSELEMEQRRADNSATSIGSTKSNDDIAQLAAQYPNSTYGKFYREKTANDPKLVSIEDQILNNPAAHEAYLQKRKIRYEKFAKNNPDEYRDIMDRLALSKKKYAK